MISLAFFQQCWDRLPVLSNSFFVQKYYSKILLFNPVLTLNKPEIFFRELFI